MADLVIKYERIATESAPPTPSRSTSKRTMPFDGSAESPRPPSASPAIVSRLPFTASSENGGCVARDCPSCFRHDQLCSAVKSRENSTKRKRFLGSEAENLKVETEDKTCADGNLSRDAPASLDARRRPQMQPPAADADAAEIEAYLSAMEKGQQRRFAEKYNYDVANDVPLEGRYEWIPLGSVGAVEETLKVTGDGTDCRNGELASLTASYLPW